MKKLFCIIVIMAIAINMLLCVVSAQGEALTYSQAESLLINSFQRAQTILTNMYLTHSADNLSSWWTDSDEIEWMCPISVDLSENAPTKDIVYKNSKGEEITITYFYCNKTEAFDPLNLGWGFLKFKSINEVKTYLNEVFTADFAEGFLITKGMPFANENGYNDIKTFVEDEEGNLLTVLAIPQTWRYDLYRIKSFSSTESYAKMTVYTTIARVDKDLYSEETVEFTNTSDGWRVSGGSLFNILSGETAPNYAEIPEGGAPQTSDTTAITSLAFAVTALVSVALPTSIIRKRRRSA